MKMEPPEHDYEATQLIHDMVHEWSNRGETTSLHEWNERCKTVIHRMSVWLNTPIEKEPPTL